MCKTSVIVPAYNAEKYIEQTLDSILSQSFSDIEIIVIDDGSTDATADRVRALAEHDARVKYIYQQNSGGPAKPRNVGLAAAQGEYIFIFDSDDIMLPGKIEKYINVFLSNNDIDVIFSDFQVIDELGNVLSESFLYEYQSFRRICEYQTDNVFKLNMNNFHEEIIKANFIGTSGVAFKRPVYQSLFDERFSSGDDILAWASLAETKNFYFIDFPLHKYRKRDGSISNKNLESLLNNKIKILAEISSLCKTSSAKNAAVEKQNEYFYSLGYMYRSQKKYADAMLAYKSIRNLIEFPKVLLALIKLALLKTKDFWSK